MFSRSLTKVVVLGKNTQRGSCRPQLMLTLIPWLSQNPGVLNFEFLPTFKNQVIL